MNYSQFATEKPILYGQISVNGKSKIGSFAPTWNGFTNSLEYSYYSAKGKKGKGGFTLKRAFCLFESGNLSTNPELGKEESYI